MEMLFKSVLGAFLVLILEILSKHSNYYLSGLVLVFPTFSLLAHYMIGTERTILELKETILLGIFGIIPYFVYLVSMYLTVQRTPLIWALTFSTFSWFVFAIFLVYGWKLR